MLEIGMSGSMSVDVETKSKQVYRGAAGSWPQVADQFKVTFPRWELRTEPNANDDEF